MKFLVIATPRAGTHYITEVFRSAGLRVGHETVPVERDFKECVEWDGLVAWQFGIPSKICHPKRPGMVPFKMLNQFSVTIHQVRHPLACLRSMHFNGIGTWRYAFENGLFNTMKKPWPIPMKSDLAVMAEFWLLWNEACEKMTDKRIRIEAIEDALPRLSEWVGVKIIKEHLEQAKVSDFGSQSSRKRPSYRAKVRWKELADVDAALCDRVKAKAAEYGYKETAVA